MYHDCEEDTVTEPIAYNLNCRFNLNLNCMIVQKYIELCMSIAKRYDLLFSMGVMYMTSNDIMRNISRFIISLEVWFSDMFFSFVEN